jgi:C-terminal processing protease CtpA/Prc
LTRRGVVALSTAVSVEPIGWTLLQRLPLTQDSFNEFARELVGLGFAFDLDKETHTLRVTKVYRKSPASQAGVAAGLIIQRIGDVPTSGKSVAECLTLLRAGGSPTVRLELVDSQRNATNTVEVSRGKFVTSS